MSTPTTKNRTPHPKALFKKPARRTSRDVIFPGFTAAQWNAMPYVKPRYELINGKLVQKVTTKRKHSKAATHFLLACLMWAGENGWQFFAEGTGVYVNETTGYVPDVVGFAPGVELDPEESMGSAPALVAEVLLHGTRKKDREEKVLNYARIGVETYVLIDPDKKIMEVFRLDEYAQKYGAPEILSEQNVWQPAELPGLKLELSKLWLD